MWPIKRHYDLQNDVHEFNKKFNFPHPRCPEWPDNKKMLHRLKLIREEADELIKAMESPEKDIAHVAQEAGDLVYVALGVYVDFGLPFESCWKAIQKANMSKSVNLNGGKPIKPVDWVPPNDEIRLAILKALKS